MLYILIKSLNVLYCILFSDSNKLSLTLTTNFNLWLTKTLVVMN